MNQRSPEVMHRLSRAASEIELNARSSARRGWTVAPYRPPHWPFTGFDLLRILERHGLEVSLTKGGTN